MVHLCKCYCFENNHPYVIFVLILFKVDNILETQHYTFVKVLITFRSYPARLTLTTRHNFSIISIFSLTIRFFRAFYWFTGIDLFTIRCLIFVYNTQLVFLAIIFNTNVWRIKIVVKLATSFSDKPLLTNAMKRKVVLSGSK